MKAIIYGALGLLLLCLAPGTCVHAQDTLLRQDFEGATTQDLIYNPDVPPYGSGGVPTWNVVQRIRGIDAAASGDHFWAVRDAENATSGRPRGTLEFDPGEICHLTSARFVFAYWVEGYDAGDDFGYVLYLDGFPEPEVILVDGVNGGGASTDGWMYDTVSIPGTAQTARLQLFFDQNGDDVAGVDDVQLLATGTDGNCRPVCGIRPGTPTLNCEGFTDGVDQLRLSLPYSGAETGAVVYTTAGQVGGDNPGSVPDGTLTVEGLDEGSYQEVRIVGGDCDLTIPLNLPEGQCTPGEVVINEVLADPGEDINGDGSIDGGDEFVELYHAGAAPVDLGRHTLHDGSNSGARFTFPAGSVLEPGERFLVLAAAGPTAPVDCSYGIAGGFLGLNNDSPETVTLRDPDGKVVAQATFDDAPDGESLVLFPEGDLTGGYQSHLAAYGTPTSACVRGSSLPVELLVFTATSLGNAVRLDWSTANERDNAGFTVERSKSGRQFTAIGRVASGNGHYSYVDYEAFPGQNLYRLRQTDLDGTETVYGPVLVRTDSGSVRVYPNPTTGKLYLSGEIAADELVTVYTPDGRLLASFTGPAANLRFLPSGLYYLRLSRPSGAVSLRFTKE